MAVQQVILYRNPNGEHFSWVCEHAAPQDAPEPDVVILCEECSDEMENGAEFVYEEPTNEDIDKLVEAKLNALKVAGYLVRREAEKVPIAESPLFKDAMKK